MKFILAIIFIALNSAPGFSQTSNPDTKQAWIDSANSPDAIRRTEIQDKIIRDRAEKELPGLTPQELSKLVDQEMKNDFQLCVKKSHDVIECPEGTYKYINSKAAKDIYDSLDRSSGDVKISPDRKNIDKGTSPQ